MPPPQGTWNPVEGPGDYTMTAQVHNDSYPAIDPTKADMTGKSVFVAGASRGIGKNIARSYVQAGASRIAIGARSDLSDVARELKALAKEVGKAEPDVVVVRLDVTDGDSVNAAADVVREKFGVLDVLVNKAGQLGAHRRVGDSDPEEWIQTMDVNLFGPYRITRAFLPLLVKSDLKTVVTVSSVGAHRVMPTISSYQISKLAVLRLMDFVAAEYADVGVIAFTVHPGNCLTDIVGMGEGMEEKFKAIFTESPALCGDVLVYLTKERRLWLSGRYVNVTWDMPELTSDAKKEEIVKGDKLKITLVV